MLSEEVIHMKKLSITLASVVLVASISTSALAAPIPGKYYAVKTGTPSSFASAFGADVNALCKNLKIVGTASNAGGNSLQDAVKALQGCDLSDNILKSFGLDNKANQNTDTAPTATPAPAEKAVPAAEEPAAEPADAAKADAGACEQQNPAVNAANDAAKASAPVQSALNSLLEKCGIQVDLGKLFQNCFGNAVKPAPSATPAPTAAPKPTAAPAPSATPAPTAKPTATPAPIVTPAPTAKPTPSATPVPTAKPTATPAPTATQSPADGKADSLAYEKQVVELVNEQRAANGLAPLKLSSELSRVARAKSQDMHDRNYFSHTSPTYGSPFDMMKAFGISYRTAGENIAKGYSTPAAVVNAWMNSPGHRANILNSSYTTIGVGYVADGHYWTQHFIG